mmetsp:Transcript_3480/g.8237  ORF Transcript_3480/g.8237 Transcript_3480/m.8237 type:complete len:419 (+) Transcript_3480:177-1433(+)
MREGAAASQVAIVKHGAVVLRRVEVVVLPHGLPLHRRGHRHAHGRPHGPRGHDEGPERPRSRGGHEDLPGHRPHNHAAVAAASAAIVAPPHRPSAHVAPSAHHRPHVPPAPHRPAASPRVPVHAAHRARVARPEEPGGPRSVPHRHARLVRGDRSLRCRPLLLPVHEVFHVDVIQDPLPLGLHYVRVLPFDVFEDVLLPDEELSAEPAAPLVLLDLRHLALNPLVEPLLDLFRTQELLKGPPAFQSRPPEAVDLLPKLLYRGLFRLFGVLRRSRPPELSVLGALCVLREELHHVLLASVVVDAVDAPEIREQHVQVGLGPRRDGDGGELVLRGFVLRLRLLGSFLRISLSRGFGRKQRVLPDPVLLVQLSDQLLAERDVFLHPLIVPCCRRGPLGRVQLRGRLRRRLGRRRLLGRLCV